MGGKVKSIERPLQSGKKNVSFDYDAMGNRIAKHVYDDNWMLEKSTYYILDATGNQLSMYEHEVDQQDVNYTLTERNIYGSSRLGRNSHKVDMYTADIENPVSSVLGEKFYEKSNHLGNVLAVFNDVKYPIASGTTVDYFEVALVSVSDYSPFGVQLDGRTMESSAYRYGFQGQEKDDEVKGEGNSINYKYRMHDPRVGRFFAVDPLAAKAPGWSPYRAFFNNPIMYIDPDGRFETRKEARQYAKDKNINTNRFFGDSRISKGKDGTFSINNKDANSSIFRDKEFGIQDATLIIGADKTQSARLDRIHPPVSDRYSEFKPINPYTYIKPPERRLDFVPDIQHNEFVDLDPTEENNQDHIDANDGFMIDQTMYSTRKNYCDDCKSKNYPGDAIYIDEDGVGSKRKQVSDRVLLIDTLYKNPKTGIVREQSRAFISVTPKGDSIRIEISGSGPRQINVK